MTFRSFISIFAILLTPCMSYALYNGAPTLPEMPENGLFLPPNFFMSVKTGYEGDFLFGRKLDSSLSDPGMTGNINGASVSLGFINRLEIYTLLAASKTKFSSQAKGVDLTIKTSENFGGEIGIRANTPIWGDMKFGADAKYFYAWPTLSQIKAGGLTVPLKGKVFQKEWQVGFSISQTFAFFTPYVGGKFSRFEMEYVNLSSLQPWVSSQKISLSNQNPFGVFLGMGIAGKKGAYFDFELRFIDEYALTGSLGISF